MRKNKNRRNKNRRNILLASGIGFSYVNYFEIYLELDSLELTEEAHVVARGDNEPEKKFKNIIRSIGREISLSVKNKRLSSRAATATSPATTATATSIGSTATATSIGSTATATSPAATSVATTEASKDIKNPAGNDTLSTSPAKPGLDGSKPKAENAAAGQKKLKDRKAKKSKKVKENDGEWDDYEDERLVKRHKMKKLHRRKSKTSYKPLVAASAVMALWYFSNKKKNLRPRK